MISAIAVDNVWASWVNTTIRHPIVSGTASCAKQFAKVNPCRFTFSSRTMMMTVFIMNYTDEERHGIVTEDLVLGVVEKAVVDMPSIKS
jgi:hypothetical protein